MLSNEYAAGLIDGEGCIQIDGRYGDKAKKYKSFVLRVEVGITNKEIVEELKATYGGSVNEHKTQPKNDGTPRKRRWDWVVCSHDAVRVLEAIYPYLHIKTEEARVAISFGRRFHVGRMGPDPDHYINAEMKLEYQKRLKELKYNIKRELPYAPCPKCGESGRAIIEIVDEERAYITEITEPGTVNQCDLCHGLGYLTWGDVYVIPDEQLRKDN